MKLERKDKLINMISLTISIVIRNTFFSNRWKYFIPELVEINFDAIEVTLEVA